MTQKRTGVRSCASGADNIGAPDTPLTETPFRPVDVIRVAAITRVIHQWQLKRISAAEALQSIRHILEKVTIQVEWVLTEDVKS